MVHMDHLFSNGMYIYIYIHAVYMVYMDHVFLYGIYANSIQTRLDFSQM